MLYSCNTSQLICTCVVVVYLVASVIFMYFNIMHKTNELPRFLNILPPTSNCMSSQFWLNLIRNTGEQLVILNSLFSTSDAEFVTSLPIWSIFTFNVPLGYLVDER